jgi:hypothetical protein
MAAGVVPQSSCSLSAQAPPSIISISAAGFEALPLPDRPRLIGKASNGLDHARQMPGAGRAGGRQRAMRRAGAAAQHGGDARHQRLVDLLRADEMDMRVDAACGEDFALARDRLGAGPDDDVDARLRIRISGLADGHDSPSFRPTSALTMPQ